MSGELKPCPFDAGEAKRDEDEDDMTGGYFTTCCKCGASVWGETPEESEAAWNTRAELSSLRGEGERASIVAWLRDQSDKGAAIALEKQKGSTSRAAFGGGSFALVRAADAIERGDDIIAGIADRIANGEIESQAAHPDSDVIGRLVGASQQLDKAIDDFLADLRERARWSKLNVNEDGTVTLPCGNGVLYRLGEARGQVGNALAFASLPDTVLPRPRRNASPSEVKTGRQGIGEV